MRCPNCQTLQHGLTICAECEERAAIEQKTADKIDDRALVARSLFRMADDLRKGDQAKRKGADIVLLLAAKRMVEPMTDNPTDSVVTDAMIEAGAKAIEACQYHGTSVEKQAVEAYRAMSQASPPLQEEVERLKIDAALALANWQKYNGNQADEIVYQAEKMASVLAALTASRMGGDDE